MAPGRNQFQSNQEIGFSERIIEQIAPDSVPHTLTPTTRMVFAAGYYGHPVRHCGAEALHERTFRPFPPEHANQQTPLVETGRIATTEHAGSPAFLVLLLQRRSWRCPPARSGPGYSEFDYRLPLCFHLAKWVPGTNAATSPRPPVHGDSA